MSLRALLNGVFVGTLLLLGYQQSSATGSNPFPNRLVTIVVPFSAGSMTDILDRPVAEKLSALGKQNVIVEKRPPAQRSASACAFKWLNADADVEWACCPEGCQSGGFLRSDEGFCAGSASRLGVVDTVTIDFSLGAAESVSSGITTAADFFYNSRGRDLADAAPCAEGRASVPVSPRQVDRSLAWTR